MNCPICNSPAHRVFQKYEYWICECVACHHRFVEITPSAEHTSQIYQDEYFTGGAAGYSDYLGEEKLLLEHGKRYGALLKKYTIPGTMLDVGAAAGFLLKGFQESGWQGMGLEPNASMASHGRAHLGLQMETGGLENFSSTQQFDLVSMIQVIAHFSDIRQALQKAAYVTRDNGFWLIESWNRESWVARLLGQNWHEYSPPSVLHWFSPLGLSNLVAQYGFSEVARGRPAKRLNGAHVKSLLGYKLQSSPLSSLQGGLRIIPDKMVIPYPTFDLFWMLFQKKPHSNS
ncbi:MAG: class I SAM-dependent methyltransferase [Anaerolineales bacterium]|nr:class I SAM-dependent methyltransferase [Anaerolineales bacterium]